jgi:hypothetical protein
MECTVVGIIKAVLDMDGDLIPRREGIGNAAFGQPFTIIVQCSMVLYSTSFHHVEES